MLYLILKGNNTKTKKMKKNLSVAEVIIKGKRIIIDKTGKMVCQ
jgi:hypothetical protein